MVAYNSVFPGKWMIKTFNATVINDIWPEVLFFTAVSVMVPFVSIKTDHLLAYGYQEGRELWTKITSASRNLAQMIWIHVLMKPIDKAGNMVQTNIESIIEKKPMGNLVQAFSVAMKRVSMPRTNTFDPGTALADIQVHRPLKPSRNPPKESVFDYRLFLLMFTWIWKKLTRKKDSVLKGASRNALGRQGTAMFPSRSAYYICGTTLHKMKLALVLMRNAPIHPWAAASKITYDIALLRDAMNNLDRIENTPLPVAYQAHLRMSLWIYLFLLPVIPARDDLFLIPPIWILRYRTRDRKPFKSTKYDLNLDGFFLIIQRELQEITAPEQEIIAPEPAICARG
ncbi:hypothetical protein BDZ89DRAFT_1114137 [Hymenopellis radicata]|nr:hypothetical protein BDZ89DRAFT_1114137 [Hymenopellis radicata]